MKMDPKMMRKMGDSEPEMDEEDSADIAEDVNENLMDALGAFMDSRIRGFKEKK